jgi:hypothetical protein
VRNAFLDPRHIPAIAENSLKSTFNFAEYLSCVLDKTMKSLFDTMIITYVAVIVCVMIWLVMAFNLTPFPKAWIDLTLWLAADPALRGRGLSGSRVAHLVEHAKS